MKTQPVKANDILVRIAAFSHYKMICLNYTMIKDQRPSVLAKGRIMDRTCKEFGLDIKQVTEYIKSGNMTIDEKIALNTKPNGGE